MKKLACLFVVFAVLLSVPSVALAGNDESKSLFAVCPKTTMRSDCLKCHVVGDFRVRETAPDADRVYPNKSMKVVDGKGHFFFTEIDSDKVKQFFDYLKANGIKAAEFEIHSPGGSLFDGQRIVNMIQSWQAEGGTVEMRLYGVAFSAGFYVFVSGSPRLVSPDSDLMWHELKSMEGFGFKVSTPSGSEEGARVLRHLQNVRNAYIATRGNITKAEIDEKVSNYKEWWMTGTEAVKFGFADGFIK